MPNAKPTMTSREAAALLVSGGSTSDADEANLMAEGKLLDPDKLTRAHFRRMVGFDFTVTETDKQFIVRDLETQQTVTAALTNDNAINASKLTKAVMRLKKLHDKVTSVPEAELA